MQPADATRLNPPPPPQATPAVPPETSPDGSSEGNLDLDDEDSINNQHLEVR